MQTYERALLRCALTVLVAVWCVLLIGTVAGLLAAMSAAIGNASVCP